MSDIDHKQLDAQQRIREFTERVGQAIDKAVKEDCDPAAIAQILASEFGLRVDIVDASDPKRPEFKIHFLGETERDDIQKLREAIDTVKDTSETSKSDQN